MKKLISLLACITLIACLVVPVSADGLTVTVTPEASSIKPTEQTTVTVDISGVPAQKTSAAIEISLSSDLEFVSATIVSNAEKRITLAAPKMKSFDKTKLKGVVMADPAYKNNPDDDEEEEKVDYIRNGTFLTLKVKLKESATETQTVTAKVIINPDEVTASGSCNIALAHDHNYVEKVEAKYLKSAASCTSKAVYYKSCSICGEASSTETFETGELAAHTPGTAVKENEVPVSCSADGSYDEVVYCTVCNQQISRTHKTVDKLAHTPGTAVRENEVPASCTAEGSYDEVVYCTVCNQQISLTHKTINKLAHTPGTAVKENEVPATCTAGGSYDEVVYCTECKAELSRTHKTTDPAEHTYIYKYDANSHWQECKDCHDPKGQSENHTFGEWTVTTQPTTEKEGVKEHVCSVCGYKETGTVDKLIAYDVTEGDNGKYEGGTTGLKIGTKVPKNGITGVEVNGTLVDPSNYEITGDTDATVTLKPSYLATLPNGNYTVAVRTATGIASANITVAAPATGTATGGSPATGMDILFWIIVLLASGAAITGSVVYGRKVR